MKNKIVVSILSMLMCFGLFATPAYASSGEVNNETPKQEEVKDEKTSEPLTPDGNLTLVDDIGTETSVDKQFVTLVSKNGNYFYLIIDRDDEGKSTVHFLNQVDEADLFALMEDEEVQKIQGELADKEKPVEPETKPTEKTEGEKETQKETKSMMPAIIAFLVLLGGGVAFVFMKLKEKKKSEEIKPDPDADYEDEEYLDDDLDFIEDEETEEDDTPKSENKEEI